MKTIRDICIIVSQTEGNTLLFTSPETSLTLMKPTLQPRLSNQPILLSINDGRKYTTDMFLICKLNLLAATIQTEANNCIHTLNNST